MGMPSRPSLRSVQSVLLCLMGMPSRPSLRSVQSVLRIPPQSGADRQC
jgi:hypothetical protein